MQSVAYQNNMHPETGAGPDGTGRLLHQPIVIQIISTQSNNSKVHVKYRHKAARVMAAMQIGLGVLSVGLNAALLGVDGNPQTYAISFGIWSPILWFIAAGFGIASASTKTTCMIVTTMVMSILSATTTIYCVSLTAVAVFTVQTFLTREWCTTVLGSLLLVVFVLEGVVAIMAAVFCCSAVCCCKPTTDATGQVVSLADLERQGVRVEAVQGAVGASAPLYTVGGASDTKEGLAKQFPAESDPPPSYDQVAV